MIIRISVNTLESQRQIDVGDQLRVERGVTYKVESLVVIGELFVDDGADAAILGNCLIGASGRILNRGNLVCADESIVEILGVLDNRGFARISKLYIRETLQASRNEGDLRVTEKLQLIDSRLDNMGRLSLEGEEANIWYAHGVLHNRERATLINATDAGLLVRSDATLINDGVFENRAYTLIIQGGKVTTGLKSEIENQGHLSNSGEMLLEGSVRNRGNWENFSEIRNTGTFRVFPDARVVGSSSRFSNSGKLQVDGDARFSQDCVINRRKIVNEGWIESWVHTVNHEDAELRNARALQCKGETHNWGKIANVGENANLKLNGVHNYADGKVFNREGAHLRTTNMFLNDEGAEFRNKTGGRVVVAFGHIANAGVFVNGRGCVTVNEGQIRNYQSGRLSNRGLIENVDATLVNFSGTLRPKGSISGTPVEQEVAIGVIGSLDLDQQRCRAMDP